MRPIVLPVLSLAALLLIWESLVWLFEVPSYLLPAPSSVWASGLQILSAVPVHVWATLYTVLAGFLVSVIIAIPLGVLISLNRVASEAIYPLLVFANAIPVIAIAPIIVVMLGTGIESRLVINFLVCFFPIMVATATGILDTPKAYLDLSRSTGAGFMTSLVTIRMPHAVPFIFSGLKIGITLSVIGAVVGEFITSNRGLGYLIVSSTTNFDLARAMFAVVVLAIMSVVLFQGVQIIQKFWFPWSIKAQDMK
ncbi:MAG: ABC transporter permease [Albidovulum sp.]|nr:ABC transporter permease [Albidovulum sp.]MDE0530815.1 ABC transporter permease [Albidovulum sp.]